MSKRDSEIRINRPAFTLSGEMVSVGSVVQVQQLVVAGPYSGDFQIINNGRLIVGNDPDAGARGIMSPKYLKGYSNAGTNTFSLYFATEGDNTPGDLHLGNMAANFLLYDHSEGTLGLYTPAGASILLDNDGSAQFGHSDGAHMKWDSASASLKILAGITSEGEVIVAEIDALGNATFEGVMTATGGRITGDMQVDAMLRAGDVDGPSVNVGKLVDEGGVAYAGLISVTDTENVPWFVVRTGDDGTGHLQIGRPGDYPNRLTLDVTPTGSTLVYDGTAYIANGNIAGWIITDQQLVSPAGYVTLDKGQGVVFTAYDYGASLAGDSGSDFLPNRMISYVNDGGDVLHRMEAWSDTIDAEHRETIKLTGTALGTGAGRSYMSLRTIAEGEARTSLRAIGGWDLPAQEDTRLDLWAYRDEHTGTFDYRRIDLETDAMLISQTDIASYAGAIAAGTIIHTDGTFDPGVGAGLYVYMGSTWRPIELVDAPIVRKTADFTADGSASYYVDCTAGDVTCTLPDASTMPPGWTYTFKRQDASGNVVYINPGTDNIDGSATDRQLTSQWAYLVIRKYNIDNWLIIGQG